MILQKPLIAAAYLCHPPTQPPLNLTQQGAPERINVFTYEASHSQSFLSLSLSCVRHGFGTDWLQLFNKSVNTGFGFSV